MTRRRTPTPKAQPSTEKVAASRADEDEVGENAPRSCDGIGGTAERIWARPPAKEVPIEEDAARIANDEVAAVRAGHWPHRAGVARPVGIDPSGIEVRKARPGEADEVTDLWLRARAASAPSVPAPIHDDEEVRTWFRAVVVPEQEVLVAVVDERVVGLLVLGEGTIEQLYVEPTLTNRRLGTLLLEAAKARFPGGLELWTFEANTGARRFYERHGFVALERRSDHSEEGPPDIHYRWP